MWNREGQVIRGIYSGVRYRGVVRSSRVKYGGTPRHTVDLLDPILVAGCARYQILVDENEYFVVEEEINI